MLEKPFEIPCWDKNLCVVGIDEAGRGPIAGPLVVAGVIFPKGFSNSLIDDSKKLTEKKRESLFSLITNEASWYEVLVIDEETVDCLNIYQATKQAMTLIAEHAPCDVVLTDAMPLNLVDKKVESIVKGDQKSLSIAAASILAKVTRDRYMMHLDLLYPQYHFGKHKGYPTKAHIEALNTYGVLPIHRKSYGPVKKLLEYRLF